MDHQFVLWVVVVATALHVMEEHQLDWVGWARSALGLHNVDWSSFYVTNAGLVVAAIGGAAIGWRSPEVSLVVPALIVVNALVFHIGISIAQRRFSPGTITAVLLYLPVAAWTYWAAAEDGVLDAPVLIISSLGGIVFMAFPIVLLMLAAHRNDAG